MTVASEWWTGIYFIDNWELASAATIAARVGETATSGAELILRGDVTAKEVLSKAPFMVVTFYEYRFAGEGAKSVFSPINQMGSTNSSLNISVDDNKFASSQAPKYLIRIRTVSNYYHDYLMYARTSISDELTYLIAGFNKIIDSNKNITVFDYLQEFKKPKRAILISTTNGVFYPSLEVQ